MFNLAEEEELCRSVKTVNEQDGHVFGTQCVLPCVLITYLNCHGNELL